MQQRWAGSLRRVAAVAVLLAVVGASAPAAPAVAAPIREMQWHLEALRVPQAHRLSTGEGVVVAVIDTGVQADHPDLAGRVLDGIRVAGTDDKGSIDRDNHGTGVAGLIAAGGGGPDHALGVAPDAEILPVAVPVAALGGTGVDDGIRWAVDHGASVINLSVGNDRTTASVTEAVRYALDHDVVIVAAAGNLDNGGTGVGSPANIPGVLAVSAVDREGQFWDGGVRGPEVAIAAPGADIVTLSNDFGDGASGYVKVPGGTSAAAPIVAGAAALVRARFPDLSAAGVVNRLIATAVDAGPPGRDEQYGFGRLDLVGALTADVPDVSANPLGEPSAAADPRRDTPDQADIALLAVVGGAAVVLLLVVSALVVVLVVRAGRRRGPRPGPPLGPLP